MLSEEVIAQNGQNRRGEKPRVALTVVASKINLEAYQSLIQWMFEICNELALHQATKFLARTYFDMVLAAYQDTASSQYLPLLVTCLSLAVKFNELRDVSDRLTPEVLLSSAEASISRENYFALEMKILTTLRFRFKYTSPYDYINTYAGRFPFLPKLKLILPTVIQFALIQPEMCEHTSEEIFYGALLSILGSQGVVLNDFQKDLLMRLTDCWGNAEIVGEVIRRRVEKYSDLRASN